MTKPIAILLGFLLALGCVGFLYGIVEACIISWPAQRTSYEIPAFLASVVTTIAAVLSTNLGAVLGITISNPKSKFREPKVWNPITALTNESQTNFQIIGCYVYIVSLVAASIVWAHRDFTSESDQILSLIPELTKSLLGVIVGVLAIALNVEHARHMPDDIKK